MIRRARFEYGGTGFFEASISTRPHTPFDSSVGGQRIAAAGMPASYVVRRDAGVELTLRIHETEWPDFLNFIIFGQSAESFFWFPDADEVTSFEVYLDAPVAGERWTPTRSSEYPKVLEATVVLRGAGIAIPWSEYFA